LKINIFVLVRVELKVTCLKKSILKAKINTTPDYSMNGWIQVITGVEFNCTTDTQGPHYAIHII